MDDAAFLLGLITDDGIPSVTKEDFDGPHGDMLRRWQERGVISRDASHFRAAGCPHCDEGVPLLLGGRYLCHVCRSSVDPGYLLMWTVDVRGFFGVVADCLRLSGGVRQIVAQCWQLGTAQADGAPVECFCCGRATLPEAAWQRLRAYRRLLVFHGTFAPPDTRSSARWVPLVELFGPDGLLVARDVAALLRVRGRVRFETATGAIRVGETWLGEVPLWGREFFFLKCLADDLDHYVPYAVLKAEVQRSTGSRGGPDEATFCQKLKSRIKAQFVPGIDRLVVTSNKSDGYRLRAEAEV